MTIYNFVSVPLSSEMIKRVVNFMNFMQSDKTLNYTIEAMIEYGLTNAECKYEDYSDDLFGLASKTKDEGGYLWKYDKKILFLPNKTQIMRKYKGKDYIARLENGEFIFDGKKIESPAQLAIIMSANTSVNAWKNLYIKRPADSRWCLAEDLAMLSN